MLSVLTVTVMAFFLQFDPADNPMHLSKIGNWVITFLPAEITPNHVWLSISSVLPIQLSKQIQPRKIIIHQTDHPHLWQIDHMEYYDSATNTHILLENELTQMQNIAESLIAEFHRYDVELALIH